MSHTHLKTLKVFFKYKLMQRKLNAEIHQNQGINSRVDCLKSKSTNYKQSLWAAESIYYNSYILKIISIVSPSDLLKHDLPLVHLKPPLRAGGEIKTSYWKNANRTNTLISHMGKHDRVCCSHKRECSKFFLLSC